MTTAARPQATPKGPGRPKMPFTRIVEAALETVDNEGADALTLRALATKLRSSTSTLYRHVDSRADLLGHVVEQVVREIDVDEASLRGLAWPQACEQIGRALFDAIARHPNVAPLLVETVPTGPRAMALRELCVSVLLANGFAADNAPALTATLGRFVIGFAIQIRDDLRYVAAEASADAQLRSADPAQYPSIHRAATGAIPLADEFSLGLDLLIRGMRDYATGGKAPRR